MKTGCNQKDLLTYARAQASEARRTARQLEGIVRDLTFAKRHRFGPRDFALYAYLLDRTQVAWDAIKDAQQRHNAWIASL